MLFSLYEIDDGTIDVVITSGKNNSMAVNCANRADAKKFVKRLAEAEQECCSAGHHDEQERSTHPTLKFGVGG